MNSQRYNPRGNYQLTGGYSNRNISGSTQNFIAARRGSGSNARILMANRFGTTSNASLNTSGMSNSNRRINVSSTGWQTQQTSGTTTPRGQLKRNYFNSLSTAQMTAGSTADRTQRPSNATRLSRPSNGCIGRLNFNSGGNESQRVTVNSGGCQKKGNRTQGACYQSPVGQRGKVCSRRGSVRTSPAIQIDCKQDSRVERRTTQVAESNNNNQQPQQQNNQATVVTTSEEDDYLFYKEKIKMLAEKICDEFNRLGFEDRTLFDDVSAAVEAQWEEKEIENARVEEEQKLEEQKRETIPELKSRMEELRAHISQKVQDITNLKVFF